MTSKSVLVSIITPSYNCSKYIRDTIKSIQSQTYENWEMVITDDCSTDDSYNIISEYVSLDSRIRLFKLPKNSGAGIARNNSIKEARGKIIAFCDSDDRWLPTKLEKQIELMLETGCDAVYSSFFTCSDNGIINGVVHCRPKETSFSIKCDDKIGNLTFMYNEERTGKIFMPIIRKRQDWVHKMTVLSVCRFALGVQEPLAIYRHASNSISRNKIKLISYNIQGLVALGWSKTKATLFFAFVFAPCYIAKCIHRRMHNNDYKDLIRLIPREMLE